MSDDAHVVNYFFIIIFMVYHLNDIDYRRRHAKLLLSLGKLGRQCGSILVNDYKNSFTLVTKFNFPSNSLNIYASVKK